MTVEEVKALFARWDRIYPVQNRHRDYELGPGGWSPRTVFMYGKVMNPRNLWGQREWGGSELQLYQYHRDVEASMSLRWNKYGGDEISRAKWLKLGGNRNVYADHYYPGAWELVPAQQGPSNCCDWALIFETAWNHPLMRQRIPDNLTLEFNVSSAFPVGGSGTYTVNFLTRGPDWGLHLTRTFQTSYGFEFGFGANLGAYTYNGPASQVTSGSLLGPTRTLTGGWFFGGSLTGGYADWDSKISNPNWEGFSAGVGSTWGASYNEGDTYPGWGNKIKQ